MAAGGPLVSADKLREMMKKSGEPVVSAADMLAAMKESTADSAHLTIEEAAGSPAATKTVSPTAMQVDDFNLRRGKEIVKNPDSGITLKEPSKAVRESEGEESDWKQAELAKVATVAADFHTACYELEPALAKEPCVEPERRKFVETLMEGPDYAALRASTVLDEGTSELAAAALTNRYLRHAAEKTKRDEARPPDKKPTEAEEFAEEMGRVRAAIEGTTKAREDVDKATAAAAAFGMGPGSPGRQNTKALLELHRKVAKNPTLRKICELAGRYRLLAQSKQRAKPTHGQDEVVGIELDGDIGRLVPYEMAQLAMPEMQWEACRRLVERQSMCYEKRSMESMDRGPVIFCVDESGSMHGEKCDTAKAIALAMVFIAQTQKRWTGLVAFSGSTGQRLLAIPPGQIHKFTDALFKWLDEFIGGGSDQDVPIKEMPAIYDEIKAPAGKCDVVFLTDACCHLPEDSVARFNAWRRQPGVQASVITLILGSTPGDLVKVSDQVFQSRALSVDDAGVGAALSI